jgi:hypothetical protein
MQATVERSGPVHAAMEPPRPAPGPARRLACIDNLKVLLVAVIIAVHAVVGYSDWAGAWAYQPAAEVRLAQVTQDLLGTLILPGVLFAMGLFFLLSGLVIPRSVDRKGPRRFARDRLLRLGIPLVVWMLGIWPAAVYAAHRINGERYAFSEQITGAEPFLDTGPLWFVEVLLIYSLAYAAFRWWRGRSAAGPSTPARAAGPLSGWTLVRLAAGISLATILVRLVFPFDGHQIGEIQLWQWPQYAGMFGLGIVSARRGWLDPVPVGIRHRCGIGSLLGLAAFGVLMGAVLAAGLEPPDAFSDQTLHWAPIALSALEGPLAVAAAVWLLGTAQRHLDRPPGPRGRALARGAYAAFILQGPVLIGVAIVLRPFALSAEVKALAVACAGVALSFGLAWVLVARTRLGRVL